ncbi:MAG: thiamine pyrophosphate-dependent enzyme [Anaerolineae bacterium]|jgi:pyruvate/2-oxoacid:ferredoxin oxidoreductase beta subunit/Pyruvate/2-oxoacid:ferredoxin oxidoreductase gamma subunit
MTAAVRHTYLDESAGAFPFCPGCGHSTILETLDHALVAAQWDPQSIVIVTDIGCIGLSDRYFQTNAFHGLHGRSITYATGIKLANPDLHVIVLIGDGGCGIGGNHLINAARRNVGITVLVANNFNFGMTGGEHSVLTPQGAITSTTRAGNMERPLDVCATVGVCGAGFVARSTVYDEELPLLIERALRHDGFALIDIWELCTAYFAPNNRFGKRDMMERLEYGGWATGILGENDRPEYARACHRQLSALAVETVAAGRPLSADHQAALTQRLEVVIAGAAGGKVRSAGRLLCRGAVRSGLYATQRDDYPVTVMTGHSVCEAILDRAPIGYTGITRPDVLILVAEEGRAKAAPRLRAMAPGDRAYVARDLLPVETEAAVIPLDYDQLARRANRRTRATLALGAVLRRENWYPLAALERAIRETQRPKIAATNLAALAASADLLPEPP